ncbi:hypothetical protein NSK_003906 [Nannochloropsis salina CCMP1776]|uniref:U2A'/phosphoprotein 32 family A C-terminal domain-containing protein n=1 Tax=Nannochloropsis salina CCMP1776 TaxID=1027361 RepID=A0A4D9D1N0_9STRA|nr:hypothetical protein NSK_003906 [Nannochloropsis salina CCMP1776]|eukprot:TFJ84874.1 hypothetical protein NSK_003906 [Nannochloropsis salina CCMP1776]
MGGRGEEETSDARLRLVFAHWAQIKKYRKRDVIEANTVTAIPDEELFISLDPPGQQARASLGTSALKHAPNDSMISSLGTGSPGRQSVKSCPLRGARSKASMHNEKGSRSISHGGVEPGRKVGGGIRCRVGQNDGRLQLAVPPVLPESTDAKGGASMHPVVSSRAVQARPRPGALLEGLHVTAGARLPRRPLSLVLESSLSQHLLLNGQRLSAVGRGITVIDRLYDPTSAFLHDGERKMPSAPSSQPSLLEDSVSRPSSRARGRPVLAERQAHAVTSLFLSDNDLTSCAGLAQFPGLRTLSLANNLIARLEDVAPLAALPHLTCLLLTGNPIRDVEPNYRLCVLGLLPTVATLDKEAVLPWERERARSSFRDRQRFLEEGLRVVCEHIQTEHARRLWRVHQALAEAWESRWWEGKDRGGNQGLSGGIPSELREGGGWRCSRWAMEGDGDGDSGKGGALARLLGMRPLRATVCGDVHLRRCVEDTLLKEGGQTGEWAAARGRDRGGWGEVGRERGQADWEGVYAAVLERQGAAVAREREMAREALAGVRRVVSRGGGTEREQGKDRSRAFFPRPGDVLFSPAPLAPSHGGQRERAGRAASPVSSTRSSFPAALSLGDPGARRRDIYRRYTRLLKQRENGGRGRGGGGRGGQGVGKSRGKSVLGFGSSSRRTVVEPLVKPRGWSGLAKGGRGAERSTRMEEAGERGDDEVSSLGLAEVYPWGEDFRERDQGGLRGRGGGGRGGTGAVALWSRSLQGGRRRWGRVGPRASGAPVRSLVCSLPPQQREPEERAGRGGAGRGRVDGKAVVLRRPRSPTARGGGEGGRHSPAESQARGEEGEGPLYFSGALPPPQHVDLGEEEALYVSLMGGRRLPRWGLEGVLLADEGHQVDQAGSLCHPSAFASPAKSVKGLQQQVASLQGNVQARLQREKELLNLNRVLHERFNQIRSLRVKEAENVAGKMRMAAAEYARLGRCLERLQARGSELREMARQEEDVKGETEDIMREAARLREEKAEVEDRRRQALERQEALVTRLEAAKRAVAEGMAYTEADLELAESEAIWRGLEFADAFRRAWIRRPDSALARLVRTRVYQEWPRRLWWQREAEARIAQHHLRVLQVRALAGLWRWRARSNEARAARKVSAYTTSGIQTRAWGRWRRVTRRVRHQRRLRAVRLLRRVRNGLHEWQAWAVNRRKRRESLKEMEARRLSRRTLRAWHKALAKQRFMGAVDREVNASLWASATGERDGGNMHDGIDREAVAACAKADRLWRSFVWRRWRRRARWAKAQEQEWVNKVEKAHRLAVVGRGWREWRAVWKRRELEHRLGGRARDGRSTQVPRSLCLLASRIEKHALARKENAFVRWRLETLWAQERNDLVERLVLILIRGHRRRALREWQSRVVQMARNERNLVKAKRRYGKRMMEQVLWAWACLAKRERALRQTQATVTQRIRRQRQRRVLFAWRGAWQGRQVEAVAETQTRRHLQWYAATKEREALKRALRQWGSWVRRKQREGLGGGQAVEHQGGLGSMGGSAVTDYGVSLKKARGGRDGRNGGKKKKDCGGTQRKPEGGRHQVLQQVEGELSEEAGQGEDQGMHLGRMAKLREGRYRGQREREPGRRPSGYTRGPRKGAARTRKLQGLSPPLQEDLRRKRRQLLEVEESNRVNETFHNTLLLLEELSAEAEGDDVREGLQLDGRPERHVAGNKIVPKNQIEQLVEGFGRAEQGREMFGEETSHRELASAEDEVRRLRALVADLEKSALGIEGVEGLRNSPETYLECKAQSMHRENGMMQELEERAQIWALDAGIPGLAGRSIANEGHMERIPLGPLQSRNLQGIASGTGAKCLIDVLPDSPAQFQDHCEKEVGASYLDDEEETDLEALEVMRGEISLLEHRIKFRFQQKSARGEICAA